MATGFNINTFRNEGLRYGGARPALFEVQMLIPQWAQPEPGSDRKFKFSCSAAQLPAATVGTVNVPYFGRNIKLAGDRTFADWSVTIMNDEDFLVRSMFEKWSNKLNKLEANVRAEYDIEQDYKAELEVTQFSKDGMPIRSYLIVGAFPTTVEPINLDWDSTNRVEEFGVTFAYDYWLPGIEDTNPYQAEARTPVAT